jgi:iron-sulfur cluster insertion protein
MVSITENAAIELKNVLEKENKQGFGLRVSVAGMGCGGPQYALSLDEKPGNGDEVIEAHGIKIFLNEQTKTVLDGLEIDYAETPQGAGFVINNPNSSASECGPSCGGCK